MLLHRPLVQPAWHTHTVAGYAAISKPADSAVTRVPPAPQYQPIPREARITRHPEYPDPQADDAKKPKSGFLSRLWPAKPSEPVYITSQDPERGVEASRRVVKEGVLDARYKRAARSYTAIIVCIPIIIFTTWELWQRRFMGKEQKRSHKLPTAEENAP